MIEELSPQRRRGKARREEQNKCSRFSLRFLCVSAPLRLCGNAFSVLGFSFILAACGNQPPRPVAERGAASGAVSPAPTFRAPATKPPGGVTQRGGGFYKDDGPGDNAPADLDAIPDAVPRAEPLHRFANNPYSVLGQDYVPLRELKPYQARGIASWYGRKFHGQKTSSGEPYDMYGMSAAHPTLPIPSYVRVTNPANGKSVVLRVNDRGPFHADRLIDLSWTAAAKLGYLGTGSTRVEVESILPGQTLPPPAATPDPITQHRWPEHPPAQRTTRPQPPNRCLKSRAAAATTSSWAPSATATTPKPCAPIWRGSWTSLATSW